MEKGVVVMFDVPVLVGGVMPAPPPPPGDGGGGVVGHGHVWQSETPLTVHQQQPAPVQEAESV